MIVTHDRWRAAVKFLMKLGTNPELTAEDQRKLSKAFRGPFTSGFSESEAGRYLTALGWRKS